MLVINATVVVEATLERLGLDALNALGDEQLVAPWLLWSEAPSAQRDDLRGDISHELGEEAIERLEGLSIEPQHPSELIGRAWRIANEFGWGETYDAEYIALAQLLGCRLVTLDGPMWRRMRKLGFVGTPRELGSSTGT